MANIPNGSFSRMNSILQARTRVEGAFDVAQLQALYFMYSEMY
jgi:hypothetical protein